MKKKLPIVFITIILLAAASFFVFVHKYKTDEIRFVTYKLDTKKEDLKFYWKNDKNENFKSIQNLKIWLASNQQTLVFAMNGGMYKPNNSPQGLFIENQILLSALDTSDGNGNFYVKPNGVFYITMDHVPIICTTTGFDNKAKIKYATQSGPMLLIDGQIHPAFKKGSTNVNIRNGVGILPNNQVVFAMSKNQINFYDFAAYFKSIGCKNALYLDGLVSRTYLPAKQWMQTDGDFGIIIGVTKVAEYTSKGTKP